MSAAQSKTKISVELMRRGAVMMKEPCPVCNGVQLKYRGKVYCTSHEDLGAALQAKELVYADVAENLKNVLLAKVKETMASLEKEEDPEKLSRLVSLMTGYVDLLQKLGPAERA